MNDISSSDENKQKNHYRAFIEKVHKDKDSEVVLYF
jgi:hypothetical protein